MNPIVSCLIVDDEPLAVNIIKRYVLDMPKLELIATCENALDAFEILKNQKVDLIFLDINMPTLSGIDFAKSLQHPPGIIFTTAYRNYAVESYELNVIDYLLKPISFGRFLKAIDKFFAQRGKQSDAISEPSKDTSNDFYSATDHIYVNANKKYVKVAFAEILYVESVKDYVRIHLAEKSITTKDKISAFAEKLPDSFIRIHRSYVVNSDRITAFTALDVEIGRKEIPIGSSYKVEVMGRLKNI